MRYQLVTAKQFAGGIDSPPQGVGLLFWIPGFQASRVQADAGAPVEWVVLTMPWSGAQMLRSRHGSAGFLQLSCWTVANGVGWMLQGCLNLLKPCAGGWLLKLAVDGVEGQLCDSFTLTS